MGGPSRWTREEAGMLVEFGSRLRAARLDTGLTPSRVELWYGINRNYVALIEQGKRNATFLMLVRLCSVYGVDPGVIAAGFRHDPDLWPFEPVQPRRLPPPPRTGG
jgi:transcriptional regulator with XRE-family HTH domain